MHASYVTCISCLARSLDLTHLWCLGIDLDPEDEAVVEATVIGDCRWGPTNDEVKLETGVLA